MATKWNQNVQFPRDNFVLRCVEEEFGISKGKENPMITLQFEIDRPEEVNIAGEQYMVVGTKITGYYTTIVLNGEGDLAEKTANAQKRVIELYSKFGLPADNINFENPALAFKGKLVWALLYGDQQEQRKSPTKEQLAKGQKQGDILKNPITNKPLLSYYPKIAEIFGPAEAQANKPF